MSEANENLELENPDLPEEPEVPPVLEEEENTISVSESILNSVKKLLGLEPDNKDFDLEIMFNINAAIFTLQQLGVGSDNPVYHINDEKNTYHDYLGDQIELQDQVKMYLFLKTKLGFDSSTMSSIMVNSYESMIKEAEVRFLYQVDKPERKGDKVDY